MIIFRVCSNNGKSYDGIYLDKTGEKDMDLIKQCLTTKYATFSDRASRKEYWGFVLFYMSFLVVSVIILGATGGGEWAIWISSILSLLLGILSLLLVIPSLAVYIRRLHDTDHSAWWLFIAFVPIIGAIVLLYFLIIKGTEGTNRFGPDPLEK
jgi:uncharacterized membrane protein YhaH (DUF805 family)